MALSPIFVENVAPLPEDGLDDLEFVKYLEDGGFFKRSCSLPTPVTKRFSSMVGKALSTRKSAFGKPSLSQKGDREFRNMLSAEAYIEASLPHKVLTEEIRSIVTGGMADGWYPTSSPGSSPQSPGAAMPYIPPFMPVSVIVPGLACTVSATPAGNGVELVQQTEVPAADDPVWIRTPLRPEAAMFTPTTEDDNSAEEAQRTTLMLRNIPPGCVRDQVMDVLRAEGFADHVVFIYLPMNLRTSGNFGYSFVDFDSSTIAERCKEQLEGFAGWNEPFEKALEVAWSESQGIEAHIQRYRDSPLMHESVDDEVKPAMFRNGVRIPFPPSTKPIRAPRLRRTVRQSVQGADSNAGN